MKKTLTLLFGAALLNAGAQEIKPCGTTEAMQAEFDKNPALYQQYLQREAQYRALDSAAFANGYENASANQRSSNMPPVYTIPVVFHILHQYGSENISDAQVYDQMNILNEDYRKLNSDISNVVPVFQSIAADCEIEFKLATIDPNGNCTNGIVRHVDANTNWPNSLAAYAYTWPRNKYLNVYVVKTISSGAAGYTYLPGSSPGAAADAIVILNSYVGSIGTGNPTSSRALTHEVGHWLNLQHVWGSTNQPGVSCGNDGVTDTPVTEGYYSQCPLTNCDICNPGTDENVQNYMEYSYCSVMFTAGQKTRMRTALTSSTASRNNLWTTTNLAATGVSPAGSPCVPIADFKVSRDYVCTNTNVTYSDLSWNGQPTSWSWSFPGGTPSTSTDSFPVVSYASPGTYNATMTVSNAQGTSAPVTKTAIITVFNSTATYNNGWQESFETSALPNADWTIDNGGGSPTWAQTTAAAVTGTHSMRIASSTALSTDDAISPGIDISTLTSPTMTFKLAYAQKNANQLDNLKVFVSTNCGSTWIQKYNKSGTSLSTIGSGVYQSTAFTPTATQWRTETINLNNVLGSTNLTWKFTFISDSTVTANHIYIDDINITGTGVGIEDQELENTLNFFVAPNPSNGQTTLNFNLNAKSKVSLEVTDMLGRTVESLSNAASYEAGEYKINLGEKKAYASGIYFINLSVENKRFTRKLMIE